MCVCIYMNVYAFKIGGQFFNTVLAVYHCISLVRYIDYCHSVFCLVASVDKSLFRVFTQIVIFSFALFLRVNLFLFSVLLLMLLTLFYVCIFKYGQSDEENARFFIYCGLYRIANRVFVLSVCLLFIGHSSSTLAVAYVVHIITMKNVFKILWFLLRVFASCACVGRLEIRPDKVVIFNGFFGVSGVWMSALYFFFFFDIVSGVCELRSECGICFVSCVFESILLF